MNQTLTTILLSCSVLACNSNPSQPLSNSPSDGGTDICVPTTCVALQKNCGAVPDNCGGTLECGTCGPGQVCGAGGAPNVCGSLQPDGGTPDAGSVTCEGGGGGVLGAALSQGNSPDDAPGSIVWLKTGSGAFGGIDADDQGNVIVAAGNVSKYDANGDLVWSFDDPQATYERVAVAKSSGDFFLTGSRLPGFTEAILVRYSADRTNRTFLEARCPDLCPLGPIAAQSDNWLVEHSRENTVTYHRPDGTTWEVSDRGSAGFTAVAFDPTGNVLIAGAVREPMVWQGQRIGAAGANTPIVLKYDNNGRFLWVVQLLGLDGMLYGIGASAIGTVVAVGRFDRTTTFGSDTLCYPTGTSQRGQLLITIEADGTPRWARQLEAVPTLFQGLSSIAVDPVGQVAIAYQAWGPCEHVAIQKFNLAGAHLWTTRLVPANCRDEVRVFGMTLSHHNVVLSGSMSGTVNFGNQAVSHDGGYLLELAQ